MRVQQAVAFFLVGWYLMLPDLVQDNAGNWHLNQEAPVSQWISYRAFDSAEQCADERAELFTELNQAPLHAPTANFLGLNKYLAILSAADAADMRASLANSAECVSTDDSRLERR
jgi:hypothetical protein